MENLEDMIERCLERHSERKLITNVCRTCGTKKYKPHRYYENGEWECEHCDEEIQELKRNFCEEHPDLCDNGLMWHTD